MTDRSNYDFHLSLRQTIPIKDVGLPFLIYLNDRKKKKKKKEKNVRFFLM